MFLIRFYGCLSLISVGARPDRRNVRRASLQTFPCSCLLEQLRGAAGIRKSTSVSAPRLAAVRRRRVTRRLHRPHPFVSAQMFSHEAPPLLTKLTLTASFCQHVTLQTSFLLMHPQGNINFISLELSSVYFHHFRGILMKTNVFRSKVLILIFSA